MLDTWAAGAGNTMLEINPHTGGYPIYNRRGLLQQDPLALSSLPWSDAPSPVVPQLW